jgi:hypothetical protein
MVFGSSVDRVALLRISIFWNGNKPKSSAEGFLGVEKKYKRLEVGASLGASALWVEVGYHPFRC